MKTTKSKIRYQAFDSLNSPVGTPFKTLLEAENMAMKFGGRKIQEIEFVAGGPSKLIQEITY